MGIGFLELVIIGVAALVLLGPKKLPEVMRQVARFYVQIRRTSNDFKSAFDHVVREAEDDLRRDSISHLKQTMQSLDLLTKNPLPEHDSKNAADTADIKSSETPQKDLSVQPPNPRATEPFSWDDAQPQQPEPPKNPQM